jgi:preprotein translocase subunit SecE
METKQRDLASKMTARKLYQYFENLKAEFKKIQWVEDGDVKVYAKVVVGATFVLGLAIYFVDLIIHQVLQGLGTVYQLLFG